MIVWPFSFLCGVNTKYPCWCSCSSICWSLMGFTLRVWFSCFLRQCGTKTVIFLYPWFTAACTADLTRLHKKISPGWAILVPSITTCWYFAGISGFICTWLSSSSSLLSSWNCEGDALSLLYWRETLCFCGLHCSFGFVYIRVSIPLVLRNSSKYGPWRPIGSSATIKWFPINRPSRILFSTNCLQRGCTEKTLP